MTKKRYTAIAIVAAILAAVSVANAQVNARGLITMLRVHDIGTAYGPPADRIDVEVVITLDTQPGKAFGFQLRNDANIAARQGMLDLLRDAYANGWPVSIDHITPSGKTNGIIVRVWLTR